MDADRLRAAANGGGRIVLPKEQVEAAIREAEKQAGLRCATCGERFEHGFELINVRQTWDRRTGEPVVGVGRAFVCGVCEGSAGAAVEAVAMREVRQKFLVEGLPGKEPAVHSTATPKDPIDGGPDLG